MSRWAVVGVFVAALVSLPRLVAELPAAAHPQTSTAQLLADIRGSSDRPFTGYAESTGSLALPDITQLGDLPSLLGDTTRMRVWWHDPLTWRVDTLSPIGEKDTYAAGRLSWLWNSATNHATRTVGQLPMRPPRAADLLPTELGRRLADAATPADASRLGGRRVAGRDALGVRIVPSDRRTTAGRIDIWADAGTGLPLRVEVFARASETPALISSFLDFSPVAPTPSVTSFVVPSGARVTESRPTDLGSVTATGLPPYQLPDLLVGLTREDQRADPDSALAIYRGGFATVLALPISSITADFLAGKLRSTGTPTSVDGTPAVAVSTPLLQALVVTGSAPAYLLAGTVSGPTLAQAAHQLLVHPPRPRWEP